jgi:NADPH:quinone reductase
MKAVTYACTGGPGLLRLVRRDRPQPRAGEVVVRVARAGVNPKEG